MAYSLGSVSVSVEIHDVETEEVRTCSDVEARYGTLSGEMKEHAYALFLNGANKVLGDKLIGLGSSAQVGIDVQDVVRPAVLIGAQAVILVHNHPSGDPTPSDDDVTVTEQVKDALALFGIDLLDHVIVGRNGWYSMRGNGDLTFNGG